MGRTLAISATSRSCSRWKSVRPSKVSAPPPWVPPLGDGFVGRDEGMTKGARVDRLSMLFLLSYLDGSSIDVVGGALVDSGSLSANNDSFDLRHGTTTPLALTLDRTVY
jgi:hypothetical protein